MVTANKYVKESPSPCQQQRLDQ